GVRAAARLHAHDAIFRQRLTAREDQRVFLGVDVVGDDGDRIVFAQGFAQFLGQRGLAGADRPADADAQGAVLGWSVFLCHERKSLECWVSCFIVATSARNVAEPRSSRVDRAARAAVSASTGSSAASVAVTPVCPVTDRWIAACNWLMQ